jgi:hypothetical protein
MDEYQVLAFIAALVLAGDAYMCYRAVTVSRSHTMLYKKMDTIIIKLDAVMQAVINSKLR